MNRLHFKGIRKSVDGVEGGDSRPFVLIFYGGGQCSAVDYYRIMMEFTIVESFSRREKANSRMVSESNQPRKAAESSRSTYATLASGALPGYSLSRLAVPTRPIVSHLASKGRGRSERGPLHCS